MVCLVLVEATQTLHAASRKSRGRCRKTKIYKIQHSSSPGGLEPRPHPLFKLNVTAETQANNQKERKKT